MEFSLIPEEVLELYDNPGIIDQTMSEDPVVLEEMGPLGYWDFNEGSGDIVYDASEEHHGDIDGAIWVIENDEEEAPSIVTKLITIS